MMDGVGALVTLDLSADSPVRDLPWIITIGPMHDDEEWEPVVCGPYERGHALALAESIVADEDLMAVVEPLLPLVDSQAIGNEIALARSVADDGTTATDALEMHDDERGSTRVRAAAPPTADEVRAGFVRIAARLTDRD
jgi:hypothetical protein